MNKPNPIKKLFSFFSAVWRKWFNKTMYVTVRDRLPLSEEYRNMRRFYSLDFVNGVTYIHELKPRKSAKKKNKLSQVKG